MKVETIEIQPILRKEMEKQFTLVLYTLHGHFKLQHKGTYEQMKEKAINIANTFPEVRGQPSIMYAGKEIF
jgi:hypothetical protein